MRKLIFAATLAALALPAAPALAQRTTVGYAVRSTNMRAGPDTDYPVVRRVARNAQVTIFGCLRDRSWCDAGYRSDRGWIPGHDLVATYRGRRREISSYPGVFVLTFIFGSYWDSHYRGRSFYTRRPQWERRYYDNHKPNWGPRPPAPPAYRQPAQPSRPGAGRPPQSVKARPQPRTASRRDAPTQAAPAPANRPSARVRRGRPTPQPTTGQQRRGNKDEGAKQP